LEFVREEVAGVGVNGFESLERSFKQDPPDNEVGQEDQPRGQEGQVVGQVGRDVGDL